MIFVSPFFKSYLTKLLVFTNKSEFLTSLANFINPLQVTFDVEGTDTNEAQIANLQSDTFYTFGIAAVTIGSGLLPYSETFTVKTLKENSEYDNNLTLVLLL